MNSRFLKTGITTGTCAAAAAKAAAVRLFGGEKMTEVSVALPSGGEINVKIESTAVKNSEVTCAVRKYSGDDPDITDGVFVLATVRRNRGGIHIDGGAGVGRITRAGLDQPIGAAAINSVPRQMIRRAVEEARGDFEGGADIVISVPEGEEIAKKTFNPRLGIEGGISILGTSGIVEPMSEKALLDTIFLELKMQKNAGNRVAVIVPGNYGANFAKSELGIKNTVICSNFIGDALDYAADLGFEAVLAVSHMGKLVKLGSGIMNTHSKYADGRMETLALCAALAGVNGLERILACVTADEAYELVRDTKTIDILMDRIDMYLKRRASIEVGAVMFSNKYGIIGKTSDADRILDKARDGK